MADTEKKASPREEDPSKGKDFKRRPRRGGRGRESSPREGSRYGQAICDSSNDASWYLHHETLAKDSGQFPFNTAVGILRELAFKNSDDSTSIKTIISAPVYALYLAPSFGVLRIDKQTAVSDFSAVDTAQMQLYSWVVYHNSRAKTYDPIDLMIYCLAMGSLVSFMSYVTRIYGLLNYYNMFNRTIPTSLLRACGLTDSAVEGVAINNFRAWVNRWITRLSSYYIPNLPYFARKYFVNQFVYADTNDQRSQLYIMVEDQWLQYNPSGNTGGELDMITFNFDDSGSYKRTLDGLMALGDRLLLPFVTDQDIGLISGDLLKAFENDRYVLPLVPENYVIIPQYNAEVCHQIHNASLSPVACSSANHSACDCMNDVNARILAPVTKVIQNTGRLMWTKVQAYAVEKEGISVVDDPADITERSHTLIMNSEYLGRSLDMLVKANLFASNRSRLIDTDSGALDPGMMLVSTRLTTNLPFSYDDENEELNLNAVEEVPTGSEYVYDQMLVLKGPKGDDYTAVSILPYSGITVMELAESTEGVMTVDLQRHGSLTHYQWLPQMIHGIFKHDSNKGYHFIEDMTTIEADLDSYTILNDDNLNRLHDVANLSLFHSPKVGESK